MIERAREVLKGLIERSLLAFGAPKLLRAARGGDAVILAYHNILPPGARPGGDRSLHLPRSEFARQLDLLDETHKIVDVESAIASETRNGGRPLAAVTFDDGYRGALTDGLEELAQRALPCTIFVPPGLLGSDALWWDALASEGEAALPDALREGALTAARGRPGEVRDWAERRGLSGRPQPAHAGVVDEDELGRAARRDGVSLGAHGWCHANLTSLEEAELEAELTRPLAWLEERFENNVVRWLSLPYGLWNEHVISRAREAGYRGVLDLSGGFVGRGRTSSKVRVARNNIPAGISEEGFRLRVAGL